MFPKLRTLTLASTRAGGAGLAALDALPDLKSLMFYHNPVEDAGYAQLETMTRLDQLSIIETPISDERVRKLKVALPKTEIAHGAIVFTGVLSR